MGRSTPFSSSTLAIFSFSGFLIFSSQPVFAQTSQLGFQTGYSVQPPLTPPTSAQELVIEFRKASSPFPFAQDLQQPVPLNQLNSTAPVSQSSLSQAPTRTWSNGEGQWKSLSNGSACLVSTSVKPNTAATMCADSF